MSTWSTVMDVFGVAAIVLLLMTLRWAAQERARTHRVLGHHLKGAGDLDGLRGWWSERLIFGAFRFARRSRHIHVAVGAVAGWV